MENPFGDAAGKQVAQVRAAIMGADQGAVADDHGQRSLELTRNGHGEVVAAPGDKSNFDTTPCRLGDGLAVGFGNLPAAVQKRTVNIERNEAYGHRSIVTGREGFEVEKFAGCIWKQAASKWRHKTEGIKGVRFECDEDGRLTEL